MSEAILPVQSPIRVGKFGFRLGEKVMIAYYVSPHGGRCGQVYGCGEKMVAVVLNEDEPGGKPTTNWFDPGAVIKI